jgi:hypothetical protein
MRLRELDTFEASNPCEVAEHKVNFRQQFVRKVRGRYSCPVLSAAA